MRLPREDDFRAPAHDTRVAARLGLWLGVAVSLCFVTESPVTASRPAGRGPPGRSTSTG